MNFLDTPDWLVRGADAFFVATALLAIYFRLRATGWPAQSARGQRPSWGGEITPESRGDSAREIARDAQAALWSKLLVISLGLAIVANLAGP